MDNVLCERARVLRCLRRPEEALPLLRQACEVEPGEAAHTLALGAAMLQVRPTPLRTCCPPTLRNCCPPTRRFLDARAPPATTCLASPAAGQTARCISPQAKQPERALEAYESATKLAEGAREGVHDVPPTRPAPLELWTAIGTPRGAPQPASRLQPAPRRTSPERTRRPSSAQHEPAGTSPPALGLELRRGRRGAGE